MYTFMHPGHDSQEYNVQKPKEKRRKHHKTKTGCKTCRVRRVKCDETKPQCLRCIKLGVECVSIFHVPNAKEPVSTIRPLAPKQQDMLALPLELIHGIRFKDIREARYYRYYCEDIAAQIRGPVKTTMWEQLIPQTGEMLPFVRDSLVSLGAFTKARSCLEESESTLHVQYGLKQYSKALNGMREHLSGTKWDYRTALFSCVLVTCCEIIQGNQFSAALHASSGENLIYEEAMRDRDHNRSPLECSRRMKLEEDLCRAFLELDLHTLTFLDRRTTAQHNRREADLTQGITYMPEEFDDIEQCYMFWQLIVARNLHFIARARKSALEESNGFKTTTNETCVWDPETCSWLSIVKLKSKDVFQTRDECLHDLIRWGQALSALMEHHPSIASKPENHAFISLMKMHSAMNQIRVGSISFVEEIEYDMFLDLFTEIIDLTPHVVPHMKKGGAFYHFGVGFILPLNTVAMHCRHRFLRNQAIDLLKSSEGYREGVGDAYSAGLANEWQRDLEEPWADDEGWVPGDRRVMITGANSNINERWAHITGMQRTGTMEGEGMKVEKLIKW